MTRRLSVLLPHRLGLLTYCAEATVPDGTVVAAPLGGRTLVGVVWDDPPDPDVPGDKLKPVVPLGTKVTIAAELRRFVDFVAAYTMTPRGALLKLVLRDGEGLKAATRQTVLTPTGTAPQRMTPSRAKVLEALAEGPLPRAALAAAAGVSPGVVTSLLQAGVLTEIEPPAQPACAAGQAPALSPEQADAAAALRDAVASATFKPFLLQGVTGSGKTEVYSEAVSAAVAAGRQALVLMPEIALTPMVVARLAQRLGTPPGEWHSGRTAKARADLWRAAALGSASVVVGARSALFLPFRDLGLIVVDEEHDVSFKQEDGVIYHARDMAVARAHAAGVAVVLASATPSVESALAADLGRYTRLSLPTRHGGTALPAIAAIDLRRTPPEAGRWLAPPAVAAVNKALADGTQALLFLNRRGYAPLTVCRRCGHRFHCPNCAAALTAHKLRAKLMCHHCGHAEPAPAACPACGATDTLVPCGPGVERLEEEARARWPQARVATLSSDLAGGAAALAERLDAIARGDVDIVVGTQLVAKGYTFPKLQLVIAVDADLSLENGDPRAGERTFQLLSQVSGRAGRVTDGGRALLQTHAPDHPVIAAMIDSDTDAFYAEEVAMRREGALPPFARLAAVVVSATDRSEAYAHAAALARTAPFGDVEVLGPAEAPLAILRGRYRFRLLARAPRAVPLQTRLAPWLEGVPVTGSVRRAVDIDPQSFL